MQLSGSISVWLQTPWQSKPRCQKPSQSHRSGRHQKDCRPEGFREMCKTLNLPVFLSKEEGKEILSLLIVFLLHIPTGISTFVNKGQLWGQCNLLWKSNQDLQVITERSGTELTWPQLKWWIMAENEKSLWHEENDRANDRKTVLQMAPSSSSSEDSPF